MQDQEPLTRAELRAFAHRYRTHPDVRTLLREIKRLRTVIFETHQYYCRIARYTDDLDERAVHDAYLTLIEEEPVINEASPSHQKEPHEAERRYPHMSEEREAKLLERERR